jgi:hypothetical protein
MRSFFREHRLLRFAGPEDEKDVGDAMPASAPQVEIQVDPQNPNVSANAIAGDKRTAAGAMATRQQGQVAGEQASLQRIEQQLSAEGSAGGAGGQTAV